MDFDFKNGLTTTKDAVDINGKQIHMKGVGFCQHERETVRILSDVAGYHHNEKDKIHFQSDSLLYYFQMSTYVLEGRVVMKGKDMHLVCDKLHVYSKENEMERVDAIGNVRLVSKGTLAKSEKAVYHFKDEVVTMTGSPNVTKDKVRMDGESIGYNLNEGKFSVHKPKMRMENGK